MAFTANHVQGIFGEFKTVIDIVGGTLTADQVQGIYGEFKPVLDNAQTTAEAAAVNHLLASTGVGN